MISPPMAIVSRGLSATRTGKRISFCKRRSRSRIKAPPPVVVLQNPLSEERSVMQTSSLPGLLDALRLVDTLDVPRELPGVFADCRMLLAKLVADFAT